MATNVFANARQIREAMKGMTRAQELKWYGEELSIPDTILLKLLGKKNKPVMGGKGITTKPYLVHVAEKKPDQALWVSELFRELVDRSGYDLKRLKGTIHKSADMKTRIKPAQLLKKVNSGGPGVFDSFVEYLQLKLHNGES